MPPNDGIRLYFDELVELLQRHGETSFAQAAARSVAEGKFEEFLRSHELWGADESIADQAGMKSGRTAGRREIERVLIALGKEQMNQGIVNPRTAYWVKTFTEYSENDKREFVQQSQTPTQPSEKESINHSRNFIARSWLGTERLVVVWWLYYWVLGGLLQGVIVGLQESGIISIRFAAFLLAVYVVWLMVSLWRCAPNCRWKGWTSLVRTWVILAGIFGLPYIIFIILLGET